jgi:alpha-galactosidase
MLAAPLMAGNDVRSMTPEIKAILTNRDVIAIDQDSLGKQGFRVLSETGREIWAKELSNGEYALCVLNSSNAKATVTVERRELYVLKGEYTVTDVWNHKPLGSTQDTISATLDPHDVILMRLTPKK